MKVYIGVDLGTTNIKAAVYDADMKLIARESLPVEYIREGGVVEFDAAAYFDDLTKLLRGILEPRGITEVAQLALTGQAESLVVLGGDDAPLMNAISWMDERSVEECEELAAKFPHDECERITGQMAVLPTWPATKILWLRRNRPEIFAAAKTYMLLKDYIVFRLTGKKLADCSIATFSFYFDIYEKRYWKKMLDAIGVRESQLPPLCEPCAVAGTLTAETAAKIGIAADMKVNVGTLDHFAGMIGTGNTKLGGMTLSTGTVMALTAMSAEPAPRDSGIAMHYGFLPDTHVMLPVAESGGVSLEWFRRNCMPNAGYDEMNAALLQRETPNPIIFLPYIVGTNAPEFDADASGMFYGLRQEHDVFDMAHAVMEGVAFVLKKNCEAIEGKGTHIERIMATGGGAKSPVWCQLQADITTKPVCVPEEKEAACLGAAMIAATADGRFADFDDAAGYCVRMAKTYEPHPTAFLEDKFRKFNRLYDAMLAVRRDL